MTNRDKPLPPIIGQDRDSWCADVWIVCPACHIAIDEGDRFCRWCWQAIETKRKKAGD